MLTFATLHSFIEESNRIEGIVRSPTPIEIDAHRAFLARPVSIKSLTHFISAVQPDARLRDLEGLNVQVGNYLPPIGGKHIVDILEQILSTAVDPFLTHKAYENLHPFTDGNGRSGRAVWLHMMGGIEGAPLGFLHHWYYQSLQH